MISTYRASFSSHPARMVVIPGFLRDDVADRLSRFLLNEAEYHAEYGIYSVEGAVAEERYLAAGDSDRFFRLHRLAGIPLHLALTLDRPAPYSRACIQPPLPDLSGDAIAFATSSSS